MRVSLSLLLTITIIFGVLLPALEAAASRRRGRVQKFRGGRSRPRLAFRQKARRGRQEDAEAEVDLNAVDGEDELAGDEAMEELYNGCDWKTNIGGFLNFCKWRKWCADNQGITDFGPYGGVPASCPPEEEGSGDDAEAADEAVEAETPAEEARRARARRGRKVAPKRKFRKTNRKTSRKSKTRRFRG